MNITCRKRFLASMIGSFGLAAQQYVPKQSDRPELTTGDEPGFKPIFDGKTSWTCQSAKRKSEARTATIGSRRLQPNS